MAGRAIAMLWVGWCGMAAGATNTSNTTTEIPAGTVPLKASQVQMFSDKYCTGDRTFIPADQCIKLGFDEWQVDQAFLWRRRGEAKSGRRENRSTSSVPARSASPISVLPAAALTAGNM
eukprot:755696-Hanusia_phi.AAC.3